MENKIKFWLMGILIASLFFASCTDDDDDDDNVQKQAYESGIFVLNEGLFQTGTGTVTYFDPVSKEVTQDIFELENNRPLGNIANDIEVIGDKAFIVVNNANKVEVVTYADFKSAGVIDGLNLPRTILKINPQKAYLTEWGTNGLDGSIRVINLNTLSVSSKISLGNGPDKMLMHDNKVFVVNVGGYGYDSTLMVLDAAKDQLIETINVGPNPNSLQMDANGKLWVLCGGKWNASWTELEQTGKLLRIDPETYVIDLELSFSSKYSTPKNLIINKSKDNLFYIYQGAVYAQNINSKSLSLTPFISKNFHSIAYDEGDDYLYGGDAKDFSSYGKIFRYDYQGIPVDSFPAGIIPTDIYFKH